MASAPPLRLILGALTLAACAEQLPTHPESAEPGSTISTAAAVSNAWTEKAGTRAATAGVAVAMAPNASGQSIVYTFGGNIERDVGSFIAGYNVATNTWTVTSSQVSVTETNGAVKIGNRIYFSGGHVAIGTIDEPSARVFAYDYRNDRLIERAPMPKRTAEGVSGAIDGQLYVLPGICCSEFVTEPIREFYRYSPTTNSWDVRRSAPHFHRQGGGAVLDGKLYVVGGFSSTGNDSPVADLDVYDPKRNTWRTLAPIPTAGEATATAFQGKLFVVVRTFETGESVVRTHAYNPETNTWKTLAPLPLFVNTAITRVNLGGKPRVFAVNGSGLDTTAEPPPSYLYAP